MRAIDINGQKFALGLWWQSHPGGPAKGRALLKDAQEQARTIEGESFTHVALRPEQYGLGDFPDGFLPKKTIPLAAALRPQGQGDLFLGVFRLGENLWWLCGLLRGQVLPEGDAVFASREEALQGAADLRANLDLPGNMTFTEVTLEDAAEARAYLAAHLGPERPLVSLYRRDGATLHLAARVALGAVLALSLAGWGYGQYQATQAQPTVQRGEVLAHPERYFKSEWLSAPTVAAAGAQCAKALGALPLSAQGWQLESATCRPGQGLTSAWRHGGFTSFSHLPEGLTLEGLTRTEAQKGRMARPLPRLAARPNGSGDLLRRSEAVPLLFDLTQILRVGLNIPWDDPEKCQLDAKTSISAPWVRGAFDFSPVPWAAVNDGSLFQYLDKFPGLALTEMGLANGTLTIKGYIYATVK